MRVHVSLWHVAFSSCGCTSRNEIEGLHVIIKIVKKLSTLGSYPNIVKPTYANFTGNIILVFFLGKRRKCFLYDLE
jgi:hypothetical protein